ncbi:ACP S-malonyltransferase [Mollicutes bacterium LVI A0039]|nr:ACP S-malonyltransferase [Mollicutes bacterium LVI A0039]
MSNVAILFPGQGSQFNNLGADFMSYPTYASVQESLFAKLPKCQQALIGELDINDTRYAQPILFANQVGILEVVKSTFDISNAVFGGFSLGEYSAYYATGKYSLEQGLEIIAKRSELMASVTTSYDTKVVLGLTKEQLIEVTRELNTKVDNPVIISNYNLEKQLLINFDHADSELVVDGLKAAGAKRVVDLAVSGPFHTKLYSDAADQFQAYIAGAELNEGTDNLYLNLTGRKYNGENLAVVMHDHMITGVAWKTEIESMIADGIDTFVELGSKSVVGAMVKKIDRSVNVITVQTVEDLEKLEDVWNKK